MRSICIWLCSLWLLPVAAHQQEPPTRIALLVSDNYSKPVADAIAILAGEPGFRDRFEIVTAQHGQAEVASAAIVVCYVHTGQVVQRFATQLEEAMAAGGSVYAVGTTPEAANYQAMGMRFDGAVDAYFEHPSPANIAAMVKLLCDRHAGTSLNPPPPRTFPDHAIVDWRTGELFQDFDAFRQAHATEAPDAPWVGLYGFRYEFVTEQADYLKAYARGLADAGFNVLLFYGFPLEKSIRDFCLDGNGKARITVLVNYSSLPGGTPEKLAETFTQLGVPVINGITLSQPQAEWEQSTVGIPVADRIRTLARPEIMGQVQPTVMATQETVTDSQGIRYERKTVLPGRITHLVNRVKAWTALRTKANADKKITLIYYNGHPGKHNIGASYLNVLPKSIHRIVHALKQADYDLGHEEMTEDWLFERVLSGGRNIGTWAPGELARLVREDDPILVPLTQYKEWFAGLHPRFRQEVVQKWGEPDSARIMVWTDDRQQRYFVLPRVALGNLQLMPQPARGWDEDEEALFHDVTLPPHHQYIAFYLYLQQQRADALIHLGTHGTLEWLSGREAGLDDADAPDALLGSLINIYPYIMDNVGEGTQAKRRGGAIIIDHLTPPFQEAGLRPELRKLAGAINDYSTAVEKSPLLADAHLKAINRLAREANVLRDLDLSAEVRAEDVDRLEHYLQELNEKQTPMGMHTFGVSPDAQKARSTALAMASRQKGLSAEESEALVTEFYERIMRSGDAEMQALLDALDGKFIAPSLGNDPIRNPDALPTGRNFYAFDASRMPTPEIYEMGRTLADQLVSDYVQKHRGTYPDKVAFNLWSVETIRHEGIMESQILSLLGVRPTYDGFGKVKGVELIPRDSLGRPRVDVVVTPSGLYRDMFPQVMNLLDQAVTLAYQAPEPDNVIRLHVDSTVRQLDSLGVDDPELRKRLALVRLFGTASGTYGIGVDNAVQASDQWEDSREIADVYFSRSGHLYGQGFWGGNDSTVSEMTGKDLALSLFRQTLSGTNAVVHSRSTNVYGVLDNDDFFQYLGGMTLAIKTLDGTEPDVVVSNLTDPATMRQESLDRFIGREMNTRYLNPTWITNMLDEGYAGARMVAQITDNMWGWQATTEQAIRAEDWQEWHDVYVDDKYALDIRQRFEDADNVYAYQGMLARMLEVVRKAYWTPDEATLNSLTSAYLETVEATGLSCSDQVCGNEQLLSFVEQRTAGTEGQAALRSLHRQLGQIQGAETAAPKSATQAAKARTPETGVQPRRPNKPEPRAAKPEAIAPQTEPPVRQGYKMEEEKLFSTAESRPIDGEADWSTIILLLAVFALGFLLKRERS